MMTTATDKQKQLRMILTDMESALIAYSGGVDSTFLAVMARQILGSRTLAVFVDSPVSTFEEKERASSLAAKLGLNFRVIEGCQMDNNDFIANTPDRCYYCKTDIFSGLKTIVEQEGYSFVADGTNADDTADYRPGLRAIAELDVRSPLREAGLTKEDIRAFSRQLGLTTADIPSSPCLATRIPYGIPITTPTLERIDKGERFLRSFGVKNLRLRDIGDTAKIEVHPSDIPLFLVEETRKNIVGFLKELGYTYVTLDLEGYRTGSLNESLVPTQQEEDK